MSQALSTSKTPFRQHPAWVPFAFIAPFVAVFLVFIGYPMLLSIHMALHQNAGPRASVYVGLQNFMWMLEDPQFWTAAKNTTVFAIACLLLQMPLALGLALLLNRDDLRGRAFWRLVFFAPVLVGLPFVAVLAGLVFEKNTGLLNIVLHETIGFDLEFPWLQSFVMPTLIIVALWMYTGFNMVYFLAALQNIDKNLLEAAEIDGANAWQRFLHIKLPAIRPVGSFVVLLSLIGSFQLFELPYLLLLETAGPNNQGLTLVMYLYMQGFNQGDLGYASAVGWVLALGLFTFAIGQQVVGRTDEGDAR